MRQRLVIAELLDSLPPEDPQAVRSRRDLRLINALMGNLRWFEREARRVPRNAHWLELGAGDGSLARRLAPDILGSGGRYTALDIAPRPEGLPEGVRWLRGDLRDPAHWSGVEVVVANLILHHFEAEDLSAIGGWIAGCSHALISEPARHPAHLLSLRLLHPFIGPVTRHDAAVSIRAGFSGKELSGLLGLHPENWHLRVAHTPLGAYRLTAGRRAGKGTG